MKTFSKFLEDYGNSNEAVIYYSNNLENTPQVIVINDISSMCEILRKNCRHHKFMALNNNDVICERFNEGYVLDLSSTQVWGDYHKKYIVLHIINSEGDLKEYIEQFNRHMSIRLPDEIKHSRKELCNLKRAYC